MSKYGKILIVICLLDLIITSVLIFFGIITEGNSVLNYFFNLGGLWMLIFIKITMNFFSIFIFEWVYYKKNISENKIINYYRLAIISYLLIIFIGTLPGINSWMEKFVT